jgi:hypothetical protein
MLCIARSRALLVLGGSVLDLLLQPISLLAHLIRVGHHAQQKENDHTAPDNCVGDGNDSE